MPLGDLQTRCCIQEYLLGADQDQARLVVGSGLQLITPGAGHPSWEELRALQPLPWGLEPPLGKREQQVHILGHREGVEHDFHTSLVSIQST